MAESIELTGGMFQVLLNLTGGDVERQTSMMRHFVRTLHRATLTNGGRWHMTMNEDDIRTMHYIFGVRALSATAQEVARHNNWLCRQSPLYARLVAEENSAASQAPTH